MFINKHNNLKDYVSTTRQIKKKLIAIAEIENKKTGQEVLGELFLELQTLLRDYSNFSEFACFINACDARVEDVLGNMFLLRKVTEYYLKNRVLNELVPEEWIQALIDKSTSRKKGEVGTAKLINILKNKKFILVNSLEDFDSNKKIVCKYLTNKKVNNYFNLTIGKKTQNKKLDLIVKNHKDFYFIEAKHINTNGGEQNKQIAELIDIIREKVKNSNYHFVSFLDGVYFNSLFDSKNKNGKAYEQKKDIINYLKSNKNNYFLNTAGFIRLFS